MGAAIATADGALVATGTNEVAKRGGGLYGRTTRATIATSDVGKTQTKYGVDALSEGLIGRMKEEGWLKSEYADVDANRFLAVFDDTRLAEA